MNIHFATEYLIETELLVTILITEEFRVQILTRTLKVEIIYCLLDGEGFNKYLLST